MGGRGAPPSRLPAAPGARRVGRPGRGARRIGRCSTSFSSRATDRELGGHDGLVLRRRPGRGSRRHGPRARAPPGAGGCSTSALAGGRGLAPGTLVIGAESVYCDISAAIPVVSRVTADTRLVEAARRALPDAPLLPIGTSAAVGGARHERAGRGDGGVRRPAGSCPRGRPGRRGEGDLERDRGGRPLALGPRRSRGGAARRAPRACSPRSSAQR